MELRPVRHVRVDRIACCYRIESLALAITGDCIRGQPASFGLFGIKDVVVTQKRKVLFRERAVVLFYFTRDPLPEDDRGCMLAFTDMSAKARGFLVSQP